MNENGIPSVLLIFTVNARSLKQKLKKYFFLVRHPFSGVDTVKTVGSYLKKYFAAKIGEYRIDIPRLLKPPVLRNI